MSTPFYRQARDAIERMFGDTSVPRSTTRDLLEELRDQVENMLDALDENEPEEEEDPEDET